MLLACSFSSSGLPLHLPKLGGPANSIMLLSSSEEDYTAIINTCQSLSNTSPCQGAQPKSQSSHP